MTERSDYKVTVKELGDGTPFLMLEPYEGDLTILANGHLSLDLLPGTTYEQAQEIARYLNANIRSFAFTPSKGS